MLAIKTVVFTAIATFAAAPAVLADQWVDYAPSKEPWQVTTVKVEGSKLDDYIISLKKSYVQDLETQKKNGDVLEYHILINATPNAQGATVVFLTKYKDWTVLAPNKERDMKSQEEFRKVFSKSDEEKMGEDRSKFRTFLDEGIFADTIYLK